VIVAWIWAEKGSLRTAEDVWLRLAPSPRSLTLFGSIGADPKPWASPGIPRTPSCLIRANGYCLAGVSIFRRHVAEPLSLTGPAWPLKRSPARRWRRARCGRHRPGRGTSPPARGWKNSGASRPPRNTRRLRPGSRRQRPMASKRIGAGRSRKVWRNWKLPSGVRSTCQRLVPLASGKSPRQLAGSRPRGNSVSLFA